MASWCDLPNGRRQCLQSEQILKFRLYSVESTLCSGLPFEQAEPAAETVRELTVVITVLIIVLTTTRLVHRFIALNLFTEPIQMVCFQLLPLILSQRLVDF